MAIKTFAIARLAKSMRNIGKANCVEDTLLSLGVAPCVALDWANEAKRGEVLLKRRVARLQRKRGRPRKPPRAAYRHILKVVVGSSREVHYHATKGYRSYRRETQ